MYDLRNSEYYGSFVAGENFATSTEKFYSCFFVDLYIVCISCN